jgi:hypothetical protein
MIAYPPLTRQELDHLVQIVARCRPAPGVVAALQGRTGGDPFLVTELVRGLRADGVLGPATAMEGILHWIASASLHDSDLAARVFSGERRLLDHPPTRT